MRSVTSEKRRAKRPVQSSALGASTVRLFAFQLSECLCFAVQKDRKTPDDSGSSVPWPFETL